MKKFEKTLFALFIVLGLCFVLSSCSEDEDEDADIDISGHIYYGTGSYAQVSRIEFTVSGGEAPYKLYYAKSINNWDYAKSNRTYIGKCNENETVTHYVDGYVSTGWYYYIWAVDDNGASSGARWHP